MARRLLLLAALVPVLVAGFVAPASAAGSDSPGVRIQNQFLSPFLCLGAGSAVGQDVYAAQCSTGDASMLFIYYGVGSDGLNYYRIRRNGQPPCVGSVGTGTSGNQDLVLASCSNDFRVLWHVEDLGNTWQIRNRSTQKCIAVANLDRSQAAQGACNGNSYSEFHMPINTGGWWPFAHSSD
jgi:hypothetical protein